MTLHPTEYILPKGEKVAVEGGLEAQLGTIHGRGEPILGMRFASKIKKPGVAFYKDDRFIIYRELPSEYAKMKLSELIKSEFFGLMVEKYKNWRTD